MARTVQYSETDAMKDVERALDRMDDNARRRVLSWASSKYDLSAHTNATPLGASPNLGHARQPQPAGDIKSFMNGKRPGNYYERVACLAYHLEKVGKVEEMNTAGINKANTDARLSKLRNAVVADATRKYGYLTSIGHGKVALSSRGEAVVDALPDREKVKEALKSNPFRRSRKKKKAGKK
jgi:hypothetical protein